LCLPVPLVRTRRKRSALLRVSASPQVQAGRVHAPLLPPLRALAAALPSIQRSSGIRQRTRL